MTATWGGAKWRPLGKQTEGRMRAHDVVCVHTMVGNLSSTDRMFKANGYAGTESHFGIGGNWGPDAAAKLDGVVYQWQDLDHEADANLDGNWHVLSIETADNAPPTVEAIADWTPKQLDALVRVLAFMCDRYDIPPVLIPDTKPGRRGIGYHRQGCRHSQGYGVPGYLVKGGELWSGSLGKGCPGPRRIRQLIDVVIPRVQAALKPPPPAPPTVQEDDMDLTDRVPLGASYAAMFPELVGKQIDTKGTASVAHLLVQGGIDAKVARETAESNAVAIAELAARVATLGTKPVAG